MDNAGKVSKDYVCKLCTGKGQDLYDYDTAYQQCSVGMRIPKNSKAVKGTWACNGERFFGALSNGKDSVGRRVGHPVVPEFKGDVTAVAGSQRLFGFQQVTVCA